MVNRNAVTGQFKEETTPVEVPVCILQPVSFFHHTFYSVD